MDPNHACMCLKLLLFIVSLRILFWYQLLHGKIKGEGWLDHLSLGNLGYTNLIPLWNLDSLRFTVKRGVEYHMHQIWSQNPFAKEYRTPLGYTGTHLRTCCCIKKAARQHNLILHSWPLNTIGVRGAHPLTLCSWKSTYNFWLLPNLTTNSRLLTWSLTDNIVN